MAFLPLQAYKLSNFKILSISKQFTVTQIVIFTFREEKMFVCLMLWQKKSVPSDKNVPLQFGTEVEVGRDSSPDCRDFIVLQLLFLLLEVIWKRSPTESSVPVKICNNECKLSISFSCNFSSKKFLESFSYRHCILFSTKIYSYIHIFWEGQRTLKKSSTYFWSF